MRARFPTLLAILVLGAGGCNAFKYNPYACGTEREGGGPPVYGTRPAQLCESARRALHIRLEDLEETPKQTEMQRIYDKVDKLRFSKTVPKFLGGLRQTLGEGLGEDFGDGVTDDVAKAIEWTRTESQKPQDPDPVKAELHLVQAAAKGVRLALEERFIFLGREDTLSD